MKLFGIVLLLLLYGFLTLSETALTAIPDARLEKLSDTDRRAGRAMKLLSRPSRFTAMLKSDRVILCLVMGGIAFRDLTPAVAGWFPAPWSQPLALLTVGLLLCFCLLLFGASIPRHIAARFPEPIALRVCGLLKLILLLTGWFGLAVSACGRALCRLFRLDPALDEERVTEEEIRLLVDVGEERGVIDESERFMIDNVFEFGDRIVGDIMTHRTDIAAIDVDSDLNEVLDFVSAEKYSRFPVYQETLDDIVGTIHVKDLMPFVRGTDKPEEFDIRKLMHKPFIAPESKKADELFRELKHSKTYIAVVIDEYGGTAGICTMEDLMESIVGSIFDEYDQEENEPVQRIGEDWLMDGAVSLDDVGERLELDFSADEDLADCDTLGGFIFQQSGRIPEPNERPVVEYRGYRFAVTQVVGRRVAQVHVSALPKEPPEDEKIRPHGNS